MDLILLIALSEEKETSESDLHDTPSGQKDEHKNILLIVKTQAEENAHQSKHRSC